MAKGDYSDEFEVDAEASESRTRQSGGDDDIADLDDRADAKVKKLKDELAQVKKEKQENMDGWQRAKADYVNLLRRFEEDKQFQKEAGVATAIEALLPALDSLDRAAAAGELSDGVKGALKQIHTGLTGLRVVPIAEDQIGQKFDPNIHEAYGQDPVDDKEKDDTITAVLEKGWRQGNRVLRPAKVRVAHFG